MMNQEEKRTVEKMIKIYCKSKHLPNNDLCDDCAKVYEYAHKRLSHCIYGNSKPTCEKCPTHCYKPTMKKQIQEIMKYSGPRMIFYHPIAGIRHIFKNFRSKQAILTLVLGLFMLASCSGIDTREWNDNLIGIYNKTNDELDDFQELISLGTVGDSTVNLHIESKALAITKEVNLAISKIWEKEVPPNGEKLHASILELLESIKYQVNFALIFTKYTEDTSDSTIEKFAEEYDSVAKKTNSKVNIFTATQKEFAESEKFEE